MLLIQLFSFQCEAPFAMYVSQPVRLLVTAIVLVLLCAEKGEETPDHEAEERDERSI